jgi:5-formyltetrahydrofolate cyclo-ligase
MTKQELRKQLKAERLQFSARDRMVMDDLMLIQFQRLSLDNWQTVLSYAPMEQQGEPNISLFEGYLDHFIPQVQFAYPVSDLQQHTITAHLVTEATIFQKNEWGIEEPLYEPALDPAQLDLVFVPMLICDLKGYRVGYGKGFYDRFLPQCRPDTVKIGFSYFEPVPSITDTHEFDVPLNYCITPKDIYEF